MRHVTCWIATITLSYVVLAQPATQPATQPTGGFLGAGLDTVNDRVADARGLNVDWGVLVTRLVSEGPAEQAGLAENDVIQKVNGRTVRTLPEIQELLRATRPGQEIAMTVVRGEAMREIKVTLGARPAAATRPA